jgi:hypothetical protein
MNKNLEVANFIERVIKKSWTFERLTEQEKQQVLSLLDNMQCKAKTPGGVSRAIEKIYSKFLEAVGYKPCGWREINNVESLKF